MSYFLDIDLLLRKFVSDSTTTALYLYQVLSLDGFTFGSCGIFLVQASITWSCDLDL